MPAIALIGALGVGVRLLLVLIGSGEDRFLFLDSASYLTVARALPGALWDPSVGALSASLERTPAYPVVGWLAGGGRVLPLILLQCVVGGALTPYLTLRLAGRWFPRRVALLAALLIAVEPVSVSHSLLVATETVYVPCLLGVLLLLDRIWTGLAAGRAVVGPAAGCGALLALATLVRPATLPLVVLVVGALAVVAAVGRSGRGASAALVVGLVALLPIVGWVARNAAVGDAPVLATVQGQNLLAVGLAAQAADEGRVGVRPMSLEELDAATAPIQAEVVEPRVRAAAPRTEGERDRIDGEVGLELIRAHPRGVVVIAVQSQIRTFTGPGHSLTELQLPRAGRGLTVPLVRAWHVGALLGLLLGSLAGTVVLVRRRAVRPLVLLVGTAVAYLLASTGPWLYVRFRVPIAPLGCILVAVAVTALWDRRRGGGVDPDRGAAPDAA